MFSSTQILIGISLTLFFGHFAEYIFKKTNIPDVFLLIVFGLLIGPHALGIISPQQIEFIAPTFTTFALLFLIYDGAFNIDLRSFATGLTKSFLITLFNFVLSTVIIVAVMLLFKFNFAISLFTGFMLGGISSAFVIPLLKQLKIENHTFTVITLESALTDVLCIVMSLAVIEIIKLQIFSVKIITGNIVALFAIAGLMGLVSGIIWIIIITKVLQGENKAYMITIAYVILVYTLTEYLGGNGAIACMFLGLVLRNSEQLITIFYRIIHKDKAEEYLKTLQESLSVTSPEEKEFYSQISFFLKTFFFVYIGILFSISDLNALLIGAIISILLLFGREANRYILTDITGFESKLVCSIFARGLAAAAIARVAILAGLESAISISNIAFSVITFTIILSSIRVFILKRQASQ